MAHIDCTMTELAQVAQDNLDSHHWQPMIILGPPGWNKTGFCTEILRAMLAAKYGVPVEDVPVIVENPARRDAAEMSGVCMPNKDPEGNFVTKFSQSPVVRRILDTKSPIGILVWDELASAKDPEQKVCSDSFHPKARFIGSNEAMNRLPDGWIVVGNGNRAHDKSGSGRLLAMITNRALVCNISADVVGLRGYWDSAELNPIMIECAEAHFDQGFFADKVPLEDGPYCTPRSLEEASHHLDVFMSKASFKGHITPLQERMLAMNVGVAAASTITQWVAQRDHVPSADEILRNPLGAKVPDMTGFQMIAANLAMGEVCDNATATAATQYILRLRTDLRVPMVAKLLRLSAREGWVVTDPAVVEFIHKHHDLLPLVAA